METVRQTDKHDERIHCIKYQSKHKILLHEIQFYGDMFRFLWVIFSPFKKQIRVYQCLQCIPGSQTLTISGIIIAKVHVSTPLSHLQAFQETDPSLSMFTVHSEIPNTYNKWYNYYKSACFDSFETSSGLSRNRSEFINVYSAFRDPEHLQ